MLANEINNELLRTNTTLVELKVDELKMNRENREIDPKNVDKLFAAFWEANPNSANHPIVCTVHRDDYQHFLDGNHSVLTLVNGHHRILAVKKFNQKALESHDRKPEKTWLGRVFIEEDLTEDQLVALARNPAEPNAMPDSCYEILKLTLRKPRPITLDELGLYIPIEKVKDPRDHLSRLNSFRERVKNSIFDQEVVKKYEKKLLSGCDLNLFTLIVNLNLFPSLKILNNILDSLPADYPEKKFRAALNNAVKASEKKPLYRLKAFLADPKNRDIASDVLKSAEEVKDFEFVKTTGTKTSSYTLESVALDNLLAKIEEGREEGEQEGEEAVVEQPRMKKTAKKKRFALEEAEEVTGTELESEGEEAAEAEKAAKSLANKPKMVDFKKPIFANIVKADLIADDSLFNMNWFKAIDDGFSALMQNDVSSIDASALAKPKTIFVGADVPYFSTDYDWDQPGFVGCRKKEFPELFVGLIREIYRHHDGMAVFFANSDFQLDEISAWLRNSADPKYCGDEEPLNITGMTKLFVDRVRPPGRSIIQANRLNLISNVETGLQVIFGKPRVKYPDNSFLAQRTNSIRVRWEGFIKRKGKIVHPAQKPIGFWLPFVQSLPDVDLVIDLFCGTASLSLAAVNERVSFIAVDKSQIFVDVAKERLAKVLVLDKSRLNKCLAIKKALLPVISFKAEEAEDLNEVPGSFLLVTPPKKRGISSGEVMESLGLPVEKRQRLLGKESEEEEEESPTMRSSSQYAAEILGEEEGEEEEGEEEEAEEEEAEEEEREEDDDDNDNEEEELEEQEKEKEKTELRNMGLLPQRKTKVQEEKKKETPKPPSKTVASRLSSQLQKSKLLGVPPKP